MRLKSLLFSFVLLLCFLSVSGQVFTSSNLPIVVITTDINPFTNQPSEIVDDPRVLATMRIIKRPTGRNLISDANTAAYLDYNGRISIEVRGSTSQVLPKKPYGFTTLQTDNTTNNNVSLLGMPSENDWILNALAFDPSLIRDYLSYNLSRQMGNYAPRTVYCEVVINGAYKGLYLLQEKIKADSNRVNILKISSTDNTTPNVTGGYITKADKTTGGDPVAWSMSSYAQQTDFIHDFPKPEEVTAQQDTYIHAQFTSLAVASHNNNIALTNGYPAIIDIPSFIDFMISNELASNVDGYQLSSYFHKDRNGKLRAGPIWDFNLTYGNDLFDWGYDRSKTDIWQFSNGDNEGAKFWTDLFNNATYKCYLSRRWNELQQTGQALQYSKIVQLIDQTIGLIGEAAERENAMWGTVPNLTAEINNMKIFLQQRIGWMNTNIGSYSACNSINLPKLVIDKIHYNPKPSMGFPESNDLEFIEITNLETTAVNLTGFYFKELGVTYKFPNNATIAAGQSFYLVSNPTQFQLRYGITAFGQFTRNLSNNSQKLVLADAFGNIIDSVEYDDESPWPDADGNGNFLQLMNTNSDNSLASSWVAANSETLSTPTFSEQANLLIFPNPVTEKLTIDGMKPFSHICITDVLGKLVYSYIEQSNTIEIDCSRLSKGVYLLTVVNQNEQVSKKIVKQ